jgi:hypothetical protein
LSSTFLHFIHCVAFYTCVNVLLYKFFYYQVSSLGKTSCQIFPTKSVVSKSKTTYLQPKMKHHTVNFFCQNSSSENAGILFKFQGTQLSVWYLDFSWSPDFPDNRTAVATHSNHVLFC